jgi:enoyl-CoA hydratase/carnithine racemase
MSDETAGGSDADAAEVLYRVDDGVAVVTLNRPDRMNAWTPALGDLYYDHLARAARDAEVRVIVVTGAGRAFCSGGDSALLADLTAGAEAGPLAGRHKPADTRDIPKPVIAAVNGAAVGVGLMMALMADIRFAAAGAKLGTGFSRLGLPAEDGMAWVLQHMIGLPAAMEFLLSGRIMVAEEAAELKLITKVLPRGEGFLDEVIAYARDIAANCSPRAMALIKRQVYLDADRSFASALSDAQLMTARGLAFPDFKEGLAAFADKRKPKFEGVSTSRAVDPLF